MKVFKNAYSEAFLAKYSKSQSKSVNAKNGVLTLKVPTLDMVVYFQVETAASTSFGINATVSSATADGSVNVAVYDAEGNATTLFTIVDGKVTANGAEPVTNSAVATDTEYSLMAHYLVNDDGSATATLVINGDTANKYTVQLANAAYSRFDLNFKAEAKNTKNVFTLSDLEMYEGDIAHKLEGTANEIAIRGLLHAESPMRTVNVTGPETVSIKKASIQLGKYLGKEPIFEGEEGDSAYLNDSSLAMEMFGYPDVCARTLIRWQAEYIMAGGRTLDKPTHFEERKGSY
jgi:hypothetical protein